MKGGRRGRRKGGKEGRSTYRKREMPLELISMMRSSST